MLDYVPGLYLVKKNKMTITDVELFQPFLSEPRTSKDLMRITGKNAQYVSHYLLRLKEKKLIQLVKRNKQGLNTYALHKSLAK